MTERRSLPARRQAETHNLEYHTGVTNHSLALQRAWRLYGERNFVYEVRELCPLGDLKFCEGDWMATLRPRLLNAHAGVFGYQRPLSPEARARLSMAARRAHQEGRP